MAIEDFRCTTIHEETLQPIGAVESVMCRTAEQAARAFVESSIIEDVGRPTLDDSGYDAITQHVQVTDESGNVRRFEATATAVIRVELTELK